MPLSARTKKRRSFDGMGLRNSCGTVRKISVGRVAVSVSRLHVPVFLRLRQGFIPHFVHTDAEAVKTEFKSHPVTVEHEFGKVCLIAHFIKKFPEYEVRFEEPVEQIKRIADVMLHLPGGYKIAGEAQLSRITTRDLSQRASDYYKAGIDVKWMLGRDANTQENRDWLIANIGEYWSFESSIEFKEHRTSMLELINKIRLSDSGKAGNYRVSNRDEVSEKPGCNGGNGHEA